MKNFFKIGFFSAFITLIPFSAFSGAISAGGFLAPVSLECLFVDPQVPLSPLNFTISDISIYEKLARLEQFNLQTVETIWAISYDQFSVQSKIGLRLYTAGTADTKVAITINNMRPVTDKQTTNFFAPLFKVNGTILGEGVPKYESELKFKEQTYQGVCADAFFIFYGSGSTF